jgi:hypothetical protein
MATGNKRHFPRKKMKRGGVLRSFSAGGVKILSPEEFLEVLEKKI